MHCSRTRRITLVSSAISATRCSSVGLLDALCPNHSYKQWAQVNALCLLVAACLRLYTGAPSDDVGRIALRTIRMCILIIALVGVLTASGAVSTFVTDQGQGYFARRPTVSEGAIAVLSLVCLAFQEFRVMRPWWSAKVDICLRLFRAS